MPLEAASRAACAASLQHGLHALSLPDDERTIGLLLGYLDLLLQWNRRVNLSAVREPAQMVSHHLLDCVAALPALDRHFGSRMLRVLDAGSGAGLPGVVWALLRPQWTVVCADAVAKKVAFVRQATAELRVPNLSAEHTRLEQWRTAPFDLVASRAFASLDDFVSATRHLLTRDGCWVAMKGHRPDDEIAALTAAAVFHVEPLIVPGLPAQRCLVWMAPPGRLDAAGSPGVEVR